MNIQNIRRNAAGGYDCEVEHEQLGWIPFTASVQDTEIHGREIFAAIERGEWGAAAEPQLLPAAFPRFVGNQKLNLFTLPEQLAVVTATMTDPLVKLMYDRLLGSAFWTYEDPETEQGLSLLVDKGLLTLERKAEIVDAMQPR